MQMKAAKQNTAINSKQTAQGIKNVTVYQYTFQ